MKRVWDFIYNKLDDPIKELLEDNLKECQLENPNDCLQQAAFKTLKKLLEDHIVNVSYDNLLNVATLTCLLTPKMRANRELIDLLQKIEHPFISVFAIYFEEDPSNYQESLRKIEKEVKGSKAVIISKYVEGATIELFDNGFNGWPKLVDI